EIEILEEAQKTQIGRDAGDQEQLFRPMRRRALDPDRRGIVDARERQQNQHVLRNKAHVEEVAGREQNGPSGGFRRCIEKDQHHGKEQEELDRVKKHAPPPADRGSAGPLPPENARSEEYPRRSNAKDRRTARAAPVRRIDARPAAPRRVAPPALAAGWPDSVEAGAAAAQARGAAG